MIRSILLLLVFFVVARDVQAIIIVDQYMAPRHERFHGGDQFLGDVSGVSFGGVGRTSGGTWVTMVSPSTFVTAGHTEPAAGDLVEFRFDNSPAADAPRAVCTIVSSTPVTNVGAAPPTDLRTGQVAGCNFYDTAQSVLPFFAIAADSSGIEAFQGRVVMQVGISTETFGSSRVTNFRVGQNRISAVVRDEVLTIGGLGDRQADWAYYADDSSGGDKALPFDAEEDLVAQDETYFERGDSGAPTFLVASTGPQLLGIHSFNDAEFVHSVADVHRASGDVLVTRYRQQVLGAVSVPEPAPWLGLLVVFSAGWVGCRFSAALPSLR